MLLHNVLEILLPTATATSKYDRLSFLSCSYKELFENMKHIYECMFIKPDKGNLNLSNIKLPVTPNTKNMNNVLYFTCVFCKCKHETRRRGGCVGGKMEGNSPQLSHCVGSYILTDFKKNCLGSKYTQPQEITYLIIKWLFRETK